MSKKYGDLTLGICSIILAVLLYAFSIPIKQFDTSAVGADFLPKIVGVLTFIIGIGITLQGYKTYKTVERETKEEPSHYLGVVLTIVLLAAYFAYIEKLGFVISTIIYLFLEFFIVTKKEEFHPMKSGILAVVTSVTVYFLFTQVFGIIIPNGLLG